MVVDSRNIELGYELLSAIPYAYELSVEGRLRGTRSAKWSEPFYYFSPKHEINSSERSYNNIHQAAKQIPYTEIHAPELQERLFPPYKEHYANHEYKWSKPTLCICNRANIEWRKGVINYFDADILEWLFSNLKKKYKIVYFSVMIPKEIQDSVEPVDIGDIEVAKKHRVTLFPNLIKTNWNETLLKVFANCDHFITMNGGYSILASYFSGTNIVYSKPGLTQCHELRTNGFWRWYPNINNVRTLHVPDYDKLKEKVTALYIDKKPLVNIVIRTSNRPIAFRRCIDSVLSQDYSNINIIAVCDDDKSLEYTRPYPCRYIVPKTVKRTKRPDTYAHGIWFPANDYIRQLDLSGYVYILDDDDYLYYDEAISDIMKLCEPDKLVISRYKLNGKTLPAISWGKKPTLYDIDSSCMLYHSEHQTDWSPWKRADYRTAKMFKHYIWHDQIIAASQGLPGFGRRKDIIFTKNQIPMKKTEKLEIQFIKRFRGRNSGDVEVLPWIEAMYMIRRGAAAVYEKPKPEKIKVQVPDYQDKELNPKRTYKRKAKTAKK
jgi:glycosyltransferase involved in cell wall biosynthesis